jgi:hypothetical protein
MQMADRVKNPSSPLTICRTRMIFAVKQLARNNKLMNYFQLMEARFAENAVLNSGDSTS